MPGFDGQNHFHWKTRKTMRTQCWMGDVPNSAEAGPCALRGSDGAFPEHANASHAHLLWSKSTYEILLKY